MRSTLAYFLSTLDAAIGAFAIVMLCYCSSAFAATVAGVEPAVFAGVADPLLVDLAAHAGVIAIVIRTIVRALRSPMFANVWERVPVRHRPFLLVGLGLAAMLFERVALGETWSQAIFVALGGVGGAVTSHEVQSRVTPRPADAGASPPSV